MQDGNFSVDGLRGLTGVGIARFAVDVVARVAAREATTRIALKDPLVDAMLAASQSADPLALSRLRSDFRRARVSNEVLADHYIPEVARRLGRGWEEDWASFAQVSIGSARLQALLRDIGAAWNADGAERQGGSTALLIVPGNDQHTMGAFAVSGLLRRYGTSVCLRIAPTPDQLAELLAQRRFDAAMISAACSETLDVCPALVKTLREETSNAMPIALGGSVLERETNFGAVSKVDIVTNDLPKAVSTLGLVCRRPMLAMKT